MKKVLVGIVLGFCAFGSVYAEEIKAVQIKIEKIIHVGGIIYDPRCKCDHTPLPNAVVKLRCDPCGIHATTDGSGAFKLPDIAVPPCAEKVIFDISHEDVYCGSCKKMTLRLDESGRQSSYSVEWFVYTLPLDPALVAKSFADKFDKSDFKTNSNEIVEHIFDGYQKAGLTPQDITKVASELVKLNIRSELRNSPVVQSHVSDSGRGDVNKMIAKADNKEDK